LQGEKKVTKDFEEDIKINKFKLAEECEQHASKYWYWANKLAEAKNDLGDSEDALKLISAQVDSDYRENWNESEWGKKTDSAVAGRVLADEKVRDAKEKLIKNQHNVNTLVAAVSAMDHRKGMLDNEVKLLIGGFYTSPTGGKKEKAVDQGERQIRNKLNKGK
jgi:hypothetical protein